MPNLRDLTADKLDSAKAACDVLLDLHRQHDMRDRETWSKIGTLRADITAAQEDGRRKRL